MARVCEVLTAVHSLPYSDVRGAMVRMEPRVNCSHHVEMVHVADDTVDDSLLGIVQVIVGGSARPGPSDYVVFVCLA